MPVVDSWGGTGWPWSWYLRDVGSGYYDMSAPRRPCSSGPLVLVADPSHEAMQPQLRATRGERFRLRVWWVPVWGRGGARRLAALGGLPQGVGADPDRDDGRMALSEPGARPTGCLRPVGLARCPRAS